MKNKIKFLSVMFLMVLVVLLITTCEEEGIDPPTGVVAIKLDNGDIHVTWNAASGARKYLIYFRTDMDSSSTRFPAGDSTTTSYTHNISYNVPEIVKSAATLYYYVKSCSKNSSYEEKYKESVYSEPASVTINDSSIKP